jgi:hypothetical protein
MDLVLLRAGPNLFDLDGLTVSQDADVAGPGVLLRVVPPVPPRVDSISTAWGGAHPDRLPQVFGDAPGERPVDGLDHELGYRHRHLRFRLAFNFLILAAVTGRRLGAR